jgi:hypothetical protein
LLLFYRFLVILHYPFEAVTSVMQRFYTFSGATSYSSYLKGQELKTNSALCL